MSTSYMAGNQTPVVITLNTSASDVHAAVNDLDVNSSISISTNAQWKPTVSKLTHICRVGSNSVPTVGVNQSSINAPLNVLQDRCNAILAPVYLQPDLLQNDSRCRIPPFRHRAADLARAQEASQVSRQKGGMGRCIKVPKDVFFHQLLDFLGVATDQSHLVTDSLSTAHPEIERLTYRGSGCVSWQCSHLPGKLPTPCPRSTLSLSAVSQF